ncbi:MAG: uroporphyrinogen-III synthase [Pseudomonadota bacterium]
MIPLLMTRPLARSKRFVADLPDALKAVVTPSYAPMWRMERGAPAPEFDAAIITSANGVVFGPEPQGRRAFCVGEATTARARDAGWDAQMAGPNADGLVQYLVQTRPAAHMMHLSGARTRGDIVERLRAAGLNAQRHIAYVQHPLPLTEDARALLQAGPTLVPLFSPDSAAHFASEAPQTGQAHIAAISRSAADALGSFPSVRLVIARTPDAQGIVAALDSLVHELLAG